jgi:hypothetical protein
VIVHQGRVGVKKSGQKEKKFHAKPPSSQRKDKNPEFKNFALFASWFSPPLIVIFVPFVVKISCF